jgi:hypothetical protein
MLAMLSLPLLHVMLLLLHVMLLLLQAATLHATLAADVLQCTV